MHCALGCEWNPHAVTHSPRVLATNSCASPAAAGKSTTRDRAPPSGSSVVPPSTTLSRRRRPRPPWSLGRTAATRPSGSAGSYHPAASSSRSRSIRSTQPLRPRCRARPSLCGTPRHRALTGAGPPHSRQVVEHAGLGDSVKIEIGDLAEKFDRIATKYSLGPRACERVPSWRCLSSLPWRCSWVFRGGWLRRPLAVRASELVRARRRAGCHCGREARPRSPIPRRSAPITPA